MDKNLWIKKLMEEIVALERFRKILVIKNPTYPFLYPTIENATYAMVNLLTYLENKNPHLITFHEDYFKNRNIAMHRAFIHDLHTATENGLIRIIKEKNFPIVISSKQRVLSIVERIKANVGDVLKIKKELQEIIKLGGRYPIFNDHLESVFSNIHGLSTEYIEVARIYFHGINILRNNVSHPERVFTKSEIKRLRKAKLGNALDLNGNFQMTFEGYKLLITDIINFFDTLYANL